MQRKWQGLRRTLSEMNYFLQMRQKCNAVVWRSVAPHSSRRSIGMLSDTDENRIDQQACSLSDSSKELLNQIAGLPLPQRPRLT